MRARLFAIWALCGISIACSGTSSSISVQAPTAVKCAVTAEIASTAPAPADGMSGTLAITTNRDCTWTATTSVAWVAITSPNTGQGSESITYRVNPNAEPAPRRGAIEVNNTQVTVSQDPAPCRYSVTPASTTVSANGGEVKFAIETLTGCAWAAETAVPWIEVAPSANGTRSGTLTLIVAVNTGLVARTGVVTIGTQTVTIQQVAPGSNPDPTPLPIPTPTPCVSSISPTSNTVGSDGSTGRILVTTGPGCAWTAAETASWLTISSGGSGSGSGAIDYAVAVNPGGARSAAIVAAGQTFTIDQAAAPPPSCTFSISPTSQNVAPAGGPGSISVSASANTCAWTATTSASWIQLTSGTSGSGNGRVNYTVAANTGSSSRSATIAAAGKTFTVTQAAPPPPPCTFTISPTSQDVGGSGGSGSVALTASANTCAWTARANASWLTVTTGASGTGDGTVGFAAAANTGAARTGTLAIGGRTFTVSQSAAPPPPPPSCTFTISPTTQDFVDTGTSGSVAITASAGTCAWTATSTAPWLTVTSGASGVGNGTVGFAVATNTGAARTGTLVIGGRTFTVSQAAPPPPPPPPLCTFSLSPTTQDVADTGTSGSVAVTASANTCAWTATSNAPWLTVTSGASGVGNGTVGLAVATNTGAARTGTLTIGGQTFTVSQAAAPPPPPPLCTFTISPTTQDVADTGTSGAVAITASANTCAWNATANAPWLTVTSGASGVGNGTVGFSVAANTGAARSGTLTIGGQILTVSQAAPPPPPPCTFMISPTAENFAADGANGSVIVTASAPTCAWTASANVAWLAVFHGASATGSDTVGYAVSPNVQENDRVGTITIAGQTFTVTQRHP